MQTALDVTKDCGDRVPAKSHPILWWTLFSPTIKESWSGLVIGVINPANAGAVVDGLLGSGWRNQKQPMLSVISRGFSN